MNRFPHESFIEDLLNVCSSLNQIQVPYMLIGGLAVALWANPRATIDLDFIILLKEEDVNNFRTSLEDTKLKFIGLHFFKLKKIKIVRFSLCTKNIQGLITVDLLLADNPFLEDALKRRASFTLLDQKIFVTTPEDLILLKLMSFRPQDIADITNLITTQKNMNFKYLRAQAKKLKVTQELKKFLKTS